ncbi:DgyrCDS4250 [Dimorphilus gyrociliatus]|uniref:nucleoside diphosphate phosphatase n=1 Tax=Dimorphilus gyrociliatus TaxID=2664684 RepID=A0A7I8VL03_9ANNE|nr:DgyrCDS4250 [Dimorphilus gyrociliatus]
MKGESATMMSRLKSKNGLIAIIIIFLIIMLLARGGSRPREFYGIIFDAGSTGSRIHVFRFTKYGSEDWKFQDELFEYVLPGLSAYSENPSNAAKSLENLLNRAKEYIPEKHWTKTPISLYATAGLRLLSERKAEEILEEVRKLFRKFPFAFHDESVKIMDASDEGLFKTLGGDQTIGAIDLGGGSIQITYVPKDREILKSSADLLHKVSAMGYTITAYTKSYLGLGLMSSRLRMLRGHESTSKFSSVCLPEGYSGVWVHQNTKYNVSGKAPKASRFQECQQLVLDKVLRDDIYVNPDFSRTKFLLLSYFYDRGNSVNLFSGLEAQVQPKNYLDMAKRICDDKLNQSPKRFLCFDLIYLGTILQEGFKFHATNNFDVGDLFQ